MHSGPLGVTLSGIHGLASFWQSMGTPFFLSVKTRKVLTCQVQSTCSFCYSKCGQIFLFSGLVVLLLAWMNIPLAAQAHILYAQRDEPHVNPELSCDNSRTPHCLYSWMLIDLTASLRSSSVCHSFALTFSTFASSWSVYS